MTKNLNWEISTKNLVTFKRWDRVRMDQKKIFGGGGGWGRGVNRLRRGAWIVCRFKRRIGKRRGHVFEVRKG